LSLKNGHHHQLKHQFTARKYIDSGNTSKLENETLRKSSERQEFKKLDLQTAAQNNLKNNTDEFT